MFCRICFISGMINRTFMLNERINYGIKSLVHVCLTCTQHLLDLRLLRQVESLLAVVLRGV